MAILGLMTSEAFSSERLKTIRRSVFYFYPNGGAPLTGVLSLLADEVTNDPEYSWYEKRMDEQAIATAAISTTICLYATGITISNGVMTAGTAAAANVAIAANTQYAIKLASDAAQKFRIGHMIRMSMLAADGSQQEVLGTVNAVNGSGAGIPNVLGFLANRTVTSAVDFDASQNIGIACLVVGSSFAEGSVDVSSGIYNTPTKIYNYTQIFRTPFRITGTALKTSATFDETGVYKDMAKEHSLNHMLEMEKCYIFGERGLRTVSGETVRMTGGLLYFLRQWEAGTTYGNIAAVNDTDDNKRIITNASGTMTDKRYNEYLERLFRVTNNRANEKLCLCGSGFLSIINQMYKSNVNMNCDTPATETYGMDIVKHRTPFGTIYYRTHPLFSQNPILRYNALFVDVNNLKHRYLDGRDTELLKNRQPNDADYRKDEWLTEAGFETLFPESHMYLQNVRDFA